MVLPWTPFLRLREKYGLDEMVKQERFYEKRSCFFVFCRKFTDFAQAGENGVV